MTEPTDTTHEITRVARSLLDGIDLTPGVRLLGVSVTQLGAGSVRQLSLDDLLVEAPGPGGGGDRGQQSRVEAAVDEVRARFGARAVGPANLIGPNGLRVARRGAQQWGPVAGPSSTSDADHDHPDSSDDPNARHRHDGW